MKNGFSLSEVISATPAEIYEAWLSSEGHASMTGSPAQVDGKVGGEFSAWVGYITGTTLALERNRRIVQSWRTSEFPGEAPDSHLESLLEEVEDGTKLTIIHTDLPAEQAPSYRQGWEDFYFTPMKRYFTENKAE